MLDTGAPPLPNVSVRSRCTLEELCIGWEQASLELMCDAAPWRTFRWRHDQRHYSGTYWSATEREHVLYESRLELTRLLFADFDPAVRRIIAQPLLLRAFIDKRVRRHVPDYLLLTEGGPIIVDVKPPTLLHKPEVNFTLDWTRNIVERRGWRYEVWSEPPPTELETIRFLAGFRNESHLDPELVEALKARDDLRAELVKGFESSGCYAAVVVAVS